MTMRDLVKMDDHEVAAFLATGFRAHVSTINKDGSPHVVPVAYVLLDGKVAFWSDNVSQKMVNLQRDPRIAAVVDTGVDFQELQGVELRGTAELRDDDETNGRIADLFSGRAPEEQRAAARDMLVALAAERTAVIVNPTRVATWDHRKLAGEAKPQDLGH